MSTNTSFQQTQWEPEVAAGIRLWSIKSVVFLLILIACLFVSAGRLDWVMGWVFFGVYATFTALYALILIPQNPELAADRAKLREGTKKWDIVIASLAVSLFPIASWIVAGFDVRNSWSPQIPFILQVIALAVLVLGYHVLIIWAIVSNKFFTATVRIQEERGHTVATGGPYRYVRHPGYVGAILFLLGTPLVLESLWAFIPCGLAALLFVVRTALEDRTLQEELDGYKDYASRVRYRLLPGVW